MPVCLSARLSVHHISICHLTSHVRSISPSPVKAVLQLPDTKMICRIYCYHLICQRRSWPYFKIQDMVRRSAEKKNYNSTFTSDLAVPICSLHIERWNTLHISVTKCRFFVNVCPNVHHTEMIWMFTFRVASFRLASFCREKTKWHKPPTLFWISYPGY